MQKYPQKFSADINWVNQPEQFSSEHEATVKRYFTKGLAIFPSDSEISIEFPYTTTIYVVTLKSLDKILFEGDFKARDGGRIWQGQAKAKLFTNSNGCFLFGAWLEEPSTGIKDTWWVDLRREKASDADH